MKAKSKKMAAQVVQGAHTRTFHSSPYLIPHESLLHRVCDKTNLALRKGCNGAARDQAVMATECGASSAARSGCIHFYLTEITLPSLGNSLICVKI